MSYTERYGKTYDEWAEEKAQRLYNALKYFYFKNEPVKLKELALQVYRERLIGVPIIKWKPVFEIFTDFKPSPFIKNFLTYVIEQLKYSGYYTTSFTVETGDIAKVKEQKVDKIKISIQPPRNITVEVYDTVRVLDQKIEEKPVEFETKIYRVDKVTRLPPYDFIKNLCYWKDPAT